MSAFRKGDAVVIRVYPGRTQNDAALLFQGEAQLASGFGYTPISQSWAEGRSGAGRVLALGMFAAVVRPDGALTVTYGRTPGHQVAADSADDMKVCPMCAESVRAAAKICRYCRHDFEDA